MRTALPWVIFLGTLFALFIVMGEIDALKHLENRSLELAALISILLLCTDLIFPIPSTLVLTFNGSLFGLVAGACVSLTGLLTAAVAGYWLSRVFGKKIVQLMAGKKADESVRPFFERFGLAAVILSRPIPMVAEMITCMAGTADMRFSVFIIGQLAGGIPLAFGYAWSGLYAADHNRMVFGLFVAVAAPVVLWTMWLLFHPHKTG